MRVAERGGEDSVRAPLRSYRERLSVHTESAETLSVCPLQPSYRVLYAGGVGRVGAIGAIGVIGLIGAIRPIGLISLIKRHTPLSSPQSLCSGRHRCRVMGSDEIRSSE